MSELDIETLKRFRHADGVKFNKTEFNALIDYIEALEARLADSVVMPEEADDFLSDRIEKAIVGVLCQVDGEVVFKPTLNDTKIIYQAVRKALSEDK